MDELIESDADAGAVYYPVSTTKFVVLSFLTFGLYQLYWFYKNWSYVRDRDSSEIMPFWRAVFSALWFPSLLLDLRTHAKGQSVSLALMVLLFVAYVALTIAYRLPDPFWIVTFLAFVPLLPVAWRISSLNQHDLTHGRQNSRWRWRHLSLAVISIPLFALTITGSVGLIPSTQVTPGWLLWPHQREYLLSSGIVEPDEQIRYFYSEGIFSIKDDGNLLTDRHVISYWLDEESNEFYVEKAKFTDIATVEPTYGDFIESTSVTITRNDGSDFILLLSAEDRRDRLFLSVLQESVDR